MADPERSSTLDLREARETLLQSFAGLAEARLDEANVVGEWSIRQTLAHIVAWDLWASETIIGLQQGHEPDPFAEEERNHAAQERYAGVAVSEIEREMRALREPLLTCLAVMSDKERKQAQFEVDGQPLSADDFAEGFIDHDLEHASEIRAWLKARNL